jgi:hypothetical protein
VITPPFPAPHWPQLSTDFLLVNYYLNMFTIPNNQNKIVNLPSFVFISRVLFSIATRTNRPRLDDRGARLFTHQSSSITCQIPKSPAALSDTRLMSAHRPTRAMVYGVRLVARNTLLYLPPWTMTSNRLLLENKYSARQFPPCGRHGRIQICNCWRVRQVERHKTT